MKIGKNQQAWLRSIGSHGGTWHPGCGFIWGTRSDSIRLCESLVRRGMLEHDPSARIQPAYRIPSHAGAMQQRANQLAAESRKRDGIR
jgi:hypothetical protein